MGKVHYPTGPDRILKVKKDNKDKKKNGTKAGSPKHTLKGILQVADGVEILPGWTMNSLISILSKSSFAPELNNHIHESHIFQAW